ncbi:alpha/beta hydrolase [Pseudoxanthomonas mexicana]|uniref:alpha/beta hydrolase n=1 Tax=Pseudoxanthomonas mexicana TaxID=128785 RepID=UPI00398AF203
MRETRLMLAAAVAMLLAGCQADGGGDTGDDAVQHYGKIAFTPCTLATPYSTRTIAAKCATLPVAEDPQAPDGRRIDLHLAWLPATRPGAATDDPVFYLAGGPGQAAMETWPSIDEAFSEVRKQRHVILLDQRGTGKSHPLRCKDDSGANAYSDGTDLGEEANRRFAQRCAESLDADPRHYGTTDAVRDLDSVRQALGVEKINLVGSSYGTRVAQQYAMRHPQHTRTIVIDGVVPNELVLGSEHARNLDQALALQFEHCQESPACKARYGSDMREQLRALMQRLQAQPQTVQYRDPSSGELREDKATDATVAGLTRIFSYAPHAAALLPLVLSEADQGRYGPLMALSRMLQNQLGEQFSHGMQLSVICSEDADLLQSNPDDAATVLGNTLNDALKAQCTGWPVNPRPQDFHAPLKTDVPALLLSGELDPVTPPRYGDQVVAHLPKGRHLVLKGQGHGTFAVSCMPKLVSQFIEKADAAALDAGCLDNLDYVPPFTGFNGWEP